MVPFLFRCLASLSILNHKSARTVPNGSCRDSNFTQRGSGIFDYVLTLTSVSVAQSLIRRNAIFVSYYHPHPKDDGRLYFQSVHTLLVGGGVPN